ncbi:MAG: hypothetical protein U0794_03780 [Isosphaeraceae bacterium]
MGASGHGRAGSGRRSALGWGALDLSRATWPGWIVVAFAAGCIVGWPARGAEPEAALGRALEFLEREVPRWRIANGCYSCHNNGDAARALYEARRRGIPRSRPPRNAANDLLTDTTAWLVRPDGWDHNGGEGAFSDKVLARVQFASALTSAIAAKATTDRPALLAAARRLAADQHADGSWPVAGDSGTVGSPAGYGRPLATLVARDVLRSADPTGQASSIARADRWLDARPLASVMDASIALLAQAGRPQPEGADPDRQRRALERLGQGQSDDGGWGPYVDAPPEPFDTALALLALARRGSNDEATRATIRRGRGYLAASQNQDGSWPETTRPAGAESYAERLSTTGWAALALMATGDPAGPASGARP